MPFLAVVGDSNAGNTATVGVTFRKGLLSPNESGESRTSKSWADLLIFHIFSPKKKWETHAKKCALLEVSSFLVVRNHDMSRLPKAADGGSGMLLGNGQ